MTIRDVIVLAVLFLWICAAILHMRKCRKNGKCIGCGGDCANCGKSKTNGIY
ncbi:MAG: FeoB-associated Cys-rich membrane protein [Anaerobutyricum sp.]|nr:FeoB-associated Cys-rich membrane protein [Eubacterium sp.]MDY6046209.1 FeoB-associated Cys-rich membrane protein [Anaerobutyricum sp.]